MPRKAHKYHYIYKTTCSVTGKYYIGMHSCSDLEDGYIGSGKRLGYSIKKYGRENHTKVILEFLPDRKSLAERERELVNQEMLNEDLCMNLKIGGEGGSTKEAQYIWRSSGGKVSVKLMHLAHIKKLNTDSEYKEKWKTSIGESQKLEKNHFFGKFHTEESKQRIRDKAKERIGDKNSQFGTCWITNGKENIKINKGDSIPENWKLGRKIKK